LISRIINTVKMKNLLKALIAIFLFINTEAANVSSYLLVVQSNSKNISLIESQNIPILYQGKSSLIVISDETSIKILEETSVYFQKIEKHIENENYFLITKKKGFDLASYSSIANTIYFDNDFAIAKNISSKELAKIGFKSAPLKTITLKLADLKPVFSKVSSAKLDSIVNLNISKINSDSVKYFVQKLQGFKTRFMLANNRKEVAKWIQNQFQRFGFDNASLDSFYVMNTWQYNVIAQISAEKTSDKYFVVGAHHDCISTNNPLVFTPGADDNASGVAAVLEIARVLKETQFKPEANILFMTFAGEEYGLFGSEDFASKVAMQKLNIELMINHDMISTSSKSVFNSSVNINYYSGSEQYTELALSCINKYTTLNSNKGDLNASYSDSYSFWSNGFKAIYFEESEFSSVYHSDEDVIDYCNVPYCTEVVKSSCATLLNALSVPAAINDFDIYDVENGTAVNLIWGNNHETDFSHFKIYLGTSSGIYDNSFVTKANNFSLTNLSAGKKYFIGLSVFDLDGNESIISEKSFTPVNFTFNKGILIVDETYDGNGNIGKPNDETVDNFYKNVLRKFNQSNYDIIERGGISVVDFANYSTVIWHGDDFVNLSAPLSAQNDLKRFLLSGGKFIYSGYTPSKAFAANFKYPAVYESGTFMYDILKISKAEKHTGSKFAGAISTMNNYPTMHADSNKVSSDFNYHMSNIEAIYPSIESNAIFLFDTKYDTSTVMGSMLNKPVGIEYLGNDYKLVLLSFPLYFMNENEVELFLTKILANHFDEVTEIGETKINIPSKFSLMQNYPNPFNPYTTIEFSIPNENKSANVELKVFDALGREISVLIDEQKSPGNYKVVFDGNKLASGFYYYRLKTDNFTEIKKMVLLK